MKILLYMILVIIIDVVVLLVAVPASPPVVSTMELPTNMIEQHKQRVAAYAAILRPGEEL